PARLPPLLPHGRLGSGGRAPRGRREVPRRPPPLRRRRPRAGGGGQGRTRRSERRREDDPPRGPDRTPGGGRGIRVPGQEPEDRLFRPGGGGTRLLPHPPRGDQQRATSAAVAGVGEGAPRPLL